VGKGELMYQIFKKCIADHQGGSCDTYYFAAQYGTHDEAYTVWLALRETVKNDSWTEYVLVADMTTIDGLRDEIRSLEAHIEEPN
jgi:hypothetical protein